MRDKAVWGFCTCMQEHLTYESKGQPEPVRIDLHSGIALRSGIDHSSVVPILPSFLPPFFLFLLSIYVSILLLNV